MPKVVFTDNPTRADYKVFVVELASQADEKVFVVDFEHQAEAHVYQVDDPKKADRKVFIVDFASQASPLQTSLAKTKLDKPGNARAGKKDTAPRDKENKNQS
jgi:hypothetical protein